MHEKLHWQCWWPSCHDHEHQPALSGMWLHLKSGFFYTWMITQGDHWGCHNESRCRLPGYVPKRKLLSDPAAIRALEGALTRTCIYRYAAHYCRVRCFSFSLQLLFDVTTNYYIFSAGTHTGSNLLIINFSRICPREFISGMTLLLWEWTLLCLTGYVYVLS